MYVVFDVDSTMEFRFSKYYHFAKKHCDKLNANQQLYAPNHRRTYDVQHVDFYNQYVVYWKQVKNRMSGTLVWQKSNTPLSCDVSSETYWSM